MTTNQDRKQFLTSLLLFALGNRESNLIHTQEATSLLPIALKDRLPQNLTMSNKESAWKAIVSVLASLHHINGYWVAIHDSHNNSLTCLATIFGLSESAFRDLLKIAGFGSYRNARTLEGTKKQTFCFQRHQFQSFLNEKLSLKTKQR